MVECHALTHSHFDGDLGGGYMDVVWRLSKNGCEVCVVRLWRGCVGVVESVWRRVDGDVVCGYGCEFKRVLNVL